MLPILFKIGPITLHTYGLMVALGFIGGYVWAGREFRREGLPAALLDRMMTMIMVSALLGARVFYFASEGFIPLRSDPFSFFRIWEGGLVFYGGFIGAIVAIVFYCRSQHIPFLKLGDCLAGPLLLGQALGRVGCFAAGCCFGRPTTHFFSVTFRNPESLAPLFISLYPTQLLSSLGDLLLFMGYLLIRRRQRLQGVLVAYYFVAYGTLRFFIEFLRGDFRGPVAGGLYPSQWISLLAVIMGLHLYFILNYDQRKNHIN